jgi:type VI secretion system protein ImpG
MDPRLLEFYNRELLYIRELGGEFSRDFPKIAGRLGLDGFECADPYVERLLEGFAFLAARVHLKLEDEFPKFTDHLLEMVYPHYLCPTPSMAVVQFEADVGQGKLEEGFTLERGTSLRSLMGIGEQTTCEYRTSQPVTLWPFNISEASYASRDVVATRLPGRMKDVKSVLRLRLKTSGGALFSDVATDRLPIYIRGRDTRTMLLYEQIFADAQGVVLSWMNGNIEETAEVQQPILPMGFDDSQALLPIVSRSFQGYRMLTEYFAFEQRFLFFELTDLNRHLRRCKSNQMDIMIPFRRLHPRLEDVVDGTNFGLYCTPAINLFPHRADRIHVNDAEVEHHLVPDRTRPMDFEVHSVLGVTGYHSDSDVMERFRPFYEVSDSDVDEQSSHSKYYALRRTQRQLSSKQRRKGPRTSYVGSEVYVSIVDADQAPYASGLNQMDVRVMCTNRDLPLSMPVGKSNTDFTLETGAPVRSIRCLAGPTEPKPSFCEAAGERSWRLISHLSLNYLSLVDGGGKGAAALREMLSLYQQVYETDAVRHSEGLVSVDAKPLVHRLSQRGPLTFGRGLEVTVTCDESRYEGSGVFLLGAVLSEFFSKYVSINSFTQTVLRTLERGEVMRWPINIGRRPNL